MAHTLLFDGNCVACSDAARAVAEMGIAGLEARSLSDPAVVAKLREGGLTQPNRPALLRDDGARLHLLTGWAMRMEMVRLVGWTRTRRIARLLAIETRARRADGQSMSRRGALGAGLTVVAGAVGSALFPGTTAAAAQPPAEGQLIRAGDAEVRRALASKSLKSAIRTWGAVHPEVALMNKGGTSLLLFAHQGRAQAVTMADNSAAATADNPTALSMTTSQANGGALHLYQTDGAALADVSVKSGQVVIREAPSAPARVNRHQLWAFTVCLLGKGIPALCIINCIGCFTGPWIVKIFYCGPCYICAGPAFMECKKEAFEQD